MLVPIPRCLGIAQRPITGLIVLSLMACGLLSGCVAPRIEYVPVVPPAMFLAPCDGPLSDPQTNGELAQALLDTQHTLDVCNIQLTGIRQWATDLKGNK